MYYQNYEDYMRSMLGYRNLNNMEYPTYMYQDEFYMDKVDDFEDYENMYPEIYRKIYPMVCKACDTNTRKITKDSLEDIIDGIVLEIDSTVEQTNVKMELKNGDVRNPNAKTEITKETRHNSNNYLRDLVKILLITELIRRNPFRPNVPPPPPGHRPPHHGGPIRPPIGPENMYPQYYRENFRNKNEYLPYYY